MTSLQAQVNWLRSTVSDQQDELAKLGIEGSGTNEPWPEEPILDYPAPFSDARSSSRDADRYTSGHTEQTHQTRTRPQHDHVYRTDDLRPQAREAVRRYRENRDRRDTPSRAPAPSTLKRSAPTRRIDSEELARAVRPVLGDLGYGNRDLEPVLEAIHNRVGDITLEHEYLPSPDNWETVMLWPRNQDEGIAIVCGGVGSSKLTVKLFNAPYGSRIQECLEPALIRGKGETLEVLRPGKVKT